jgi:hypothetical protein
MILKTSRPLRAIVTMQPAWMKSFLHEADCLQLVKAVRPLKQPSNAFTFSNLFIRTFHVGIPLNAQELKSHRHKFVLKEPPSALQVDRFRFGVSYHDSGRINNKITRASVR